MTRATKIILVVGIAIIVAASIGGWNWILKDIERSRIEAEEAAAAEAAKLMEVSASEPEKKVYNTPPIKAEPKKTASSASGQKPLEGEPDETDGQGTGDASKPDLEPPPPPESSEDSKQESKIEQSTPSKAPASSAAPKEETPASSKASSTPKDGDRKTVDGKEYVYVKGFGWSPITGSKGETTTGSGDKNKQVGQMG